MSKFATCCICGKQFEVTKHYWGNNPEPVMPNYDKKNNTMNWCCDECNCDVVIPARIKESGTVIKR